MVAKKSGGKIGKSVKVGKLKLARETVKALTTTEVKKIKGGDGTAYKHKTDVKI